MRKNRSSSDRNQRLPDVETADSIARSRHEGESCQAGALAALAAQGALLTRPDWAPPDLEEFFCEAVETICADENLSWQAFVDQAYARFPHSAPETAIRIAVTEYFYAQAEWPPTHILLNRGGFDGIHPAQQRAGISTDTDMGRYADARRGDSQDCSAPLQAEWD
jgi:hypothetical protein